MSSGATFARKMASVAAGVVAVVWQSCAAPDPSNGPGTKVETVNEQKLQHARSSFLRSELLRRQYSVSAAAAAIRGYRAARVHSHQIGDQEGVARAWHRIGLTLEQGGRLDESVAAYRASLEAAGQTDARPLESRILADLGLVESSLGQIDSAHDHCRQALSIGQAIGDAGAEALALNCLGEYEYHRGNLEAAIEAHRMALGHWVDQEDKEGQARTSYYLGSIHSDLSNVENAAGHLGRANSLWLEIGDARGRALTLLATGQLHNRLGQFQEALNSYREAMVTVDQMGDRLWKASLMGAFGTVYEQMAEYPTALDYWHQALALHREVGLPIAVVDALLSVGEIHMASGNYSDALEHFEKAQEVSRNLGDDRLTAYSLSFVGVANQALGDHELALESYKASLSLQDSTQDSRLTSQILGYMGRVYLETGALEPALDHLSRAISISRQAGDQLSEATSLYHLARLADDEADFDGAIQHLETALEIAESLRGGVDSRDLRRAYFASIQHYYKLHIDLLMRRHKIDPDRGYSADAFAACERARARALLDSLAEAGVDLRQGVDEDLLEAERALKQNLEASTRETMRVGTDSTQAARLASQTRDLSTRYDQVQAEIRSKSPRYVSLNRPEPLHLREIQSRILDRDTVLLEYSLGEERSYLWVVSSTNLRGVELPPRSQIEGSALAVQKALTARLRLDQETLADHRQRIRQADNDYHEIAGLLSETLLGSVIDELAGKRLLVVVEGALQYVPFAALPIPARAGDPTLLIRDHEVVHLPSASTLAFLRDQAATRPSPTMTLAVMADPVFELDDPRLGRAQRPQRKETLTPSGQIRLVDAPLRGIQFSGASSQTGVPRLVATRQEADSILALVPADQKLRATDFAASRALALDARLGQYRFVHFATHGIVNNEIPALSGILLSTLDESGHRRDGFLRLHDIYSLDLPVDLVVLSACNSALGKPVDGEGLVGIVQAFMYAGAKRVVASLWKVDDEATGFLMSRFYREMLVLGHPPAAALRNAQMAMTQHSDWHHPFYWAAFVLQGEW